MRPNRLRTPWQADRGVMAGIHNASPEAAPARIAQGFRFITISLDARLRPVGARQAMATMRSAQAPVV